MLDDGVDPDRVVRVASALAVGERDPNHSLCAASAALVGVSGAGMVLMSGGKLLGNVCVSDAAIEAVEEVQFTLGEGPCVDACRTGQPVLVPDLSSRDMVSWPAFRDGALAAGMHAAFGFPLRVGGACIGALNLFHDTSGALSPEQYEEALVVAHVAGRIVMGWQAVVGGESVAWQLEQIPAHRAVVHQASGMVSLQAGVSVDDA